MLASAVIKLFSKESKVFNDQNLKGQFSQTFYQIDTLLRKAKGTIMGEAKDYTGRNAKVGRPDLQKLSDALCDLEVTGGLFFSATDYTEPAKKYANAALEP